MVASRIIHRNLGGKQLGRRIHKTVEDMILLIEDRHHIAVEKEEIRLFQITFGNQVRQHVILSMYIVYHRK